MLNILRIRSASSSELQDGITSVAKINKTIMRMTDFPPKENLLPLNILELQNILIVIGLLLSVFFFTLFTSLLLLAPKQMPRRLPNSANNKEIHSRIPNNISQLQTP